MNKLSTNGNFLSQQMRLSLLFLSSPGFPSKAAEQWMLSQDQWSEVLRGEDQGLIWTHDEDNCRSASQELVIQLPGAPEIKVILLAMNVIRVSGNRRKRLRKKKLLLAHKSTRNREISSEIMVTLRVTMCFSKHTKWGSTLQGSSLWSLYRSFIDYRTFL